jgi:cell wall-associated NlpC family hydrolase
MGDIVGMFDGRQPPSQPDYAHVGIYFGNGLFMSASFHPDPTGSGLQDHVLIQTLIDGYNHIIFRSTGP